MSEWKGKGIWMPVLDNDVVDAIQHWNGAATYVVANILRRKERYKHVKTSQVLHRLKAMEAKGLVRRVTDSRNPYSRQLMWELPESPK